MKKIISFISLIFVLLMVPLGVSAASASIKVTSSTTTAVYGNTVTYTVTLSSSTKIGSWDMKLSYDSSYLSLQSTTAENGSAMAGSSSTGTYTVTYTYKFTTLKTGSTKVSVDAYEVFDFTNMSSMSISTTSKTINIKTQAEIEASYSSDNSLSALSVEGFDLEEEFSKDVYEYTVNVPEDTSTITINSSKNDSTASISGTGEFEVSSGANVFEVLVTAQNGSEQIYKVTVNVIDENPISVTIDNENYTVVKIAEYLTKPEYFEESSVIINDIEVPCFINDSLGYTLIGLKDSVGNINLYTYDSLTLDYVLYNEITFSSLTVIPISSKNTVEGYSKFTEELFGSSLEVYKINEDSRFLIFYGINVETGEENFYQYDLVDETIIVYDEEYINLLNTQIEEYTNIILLFAGALSLTFILLIFVIAKKGSKKKKKSSNEVTEIKEENLKDTKKLEVPIDTKKEKKVKKSNKKKKVEEDF